MMFSGDVWSAPVRDEVVLHVDLNQNENVQ